MTACIFIDSRINAAAALLAGLAPDTRVVVVDAARNGIVQMAQALSGVTGLEAIHVISHGGDGTLHLGASAITSENIAVYAADLQVIGASLAKNGDILLYGCDMAAKQTGQRFIEQLANLTGADVAASTDATGAAALGGDWLLEAQTGAIESAALNLAAYGGLLDVINGDNNPNNLPGTINNDLITGLGGNDTIDGAAGFDTSIYNGPSTGYGFSRSGANLIVTDVNPANGNEGADQLINVEAAQFTDGTITFGQAGELRVNSYVTSVQANASIAALASGGFVVTWQSAFQDGNDYGIYAQRYAASGIAVGSEIRVNTTTAARQESPATAGLTGGGFVVAWMSNQNGNDDIYAQRYDANGNTQGNEFRVNTVVTDDQSSPSIVALANGGFVVTWQSFNQVLPTSNYDIYFQRYDANGVAQGEELRADTLISGPQVLSAITQLTSGDLVIVWDSPFEITAQRFDSTGGVQQIEFVVNTYTTSTQSAPAIAALSGGGFVVTWHSLNQDGSGYGIYAQRFNATGSALGPEFRVNTTTSLAQTNPAIAALANGGFVVAWESADSSSFGIYAQRYDANGAALGGEFRINVNTFNSQLTSAITALADGGFVVTWESTHDDPNYDVYARRFDAAGNPVGETILTGDAANNVLRWTGADTVLLDGGDGNDLAAQGGDSGGYRFSFVDGNVAITDVNPGNGVEGGKKLINIEAAQFTDGTVGIGPVNEFRVNTFVANSQDAPAIATLADGGYVVTWNSFGQDNAFSYGIYAQRYDAAGRTQGAEFRVNTFVDTDQLAPTIAALNNGGFVVAWQSNAQDGSQYGIYAQRYDAAGNPQGGEFRANTVTTDQQIDPAVTALANGGFALTWTSANQAGAGTSFDIYARRYDANGVAQGNEFLVNTFTANIQDAPAVAALANGGFVVTWESLNQAFSGSEYDIYARRYDANGAASGAEFLVQTGPVANNQIQPSIAVLRDSGLIVTFLNDANSGYFLHRFDANGVSQGGDIQIALSGLVYGIARVTALADGGFVVTYWTNGGGNDVYVQRFNASGVKIGSEIRANAATANPQELPAIAALPDGGFVVTWQSAGQDIDYGIYARRFDASGNPVATTLTGDGGNNNIVWSGTQAIVLDGGAGGDTLAGGGGNDTYFTDGLDAINEPLNAGIDTVFSSAVNYTLGDNLENLTLIGSGDISGSGNALANRITGNSGNNLLRGGAGNDTLNGGPGVDTGDYSDATSAINANLATGVVSGGSGTDTLTSIENLIGSSFNDTLNSSTSNNVLNGGLGLDITVYNSALAAYTISRSGLTITVSGPDGTDTLTGIEKLRFTDITIPISPSWGIDPSGDGKSDVQWRNSTGEVALWLMDGLTPTAQAVFGSVPVSMSIVDGNGDFNGDGKSDILWRDSNGDVTMWLMNGITPTAQTLIGSVPNTWTLVDGHGDYNGDGKDDLLWRNSNGDTALWLMNGTAFLGQAVFGSIPTSWSLIDGSGDYNGDGKGDLLWRNSSGDTALWLMNGLTPIGQAVFGSVPITWNIVDGHGDYNGDGNSDLLWRNSTGDVALWLMNGLTPIGQAVFGSVPTTWSIVEGHGEYNGDGNSDVLWRNSTGDVALWLMNGVTPIGQAVFGSVPNTWTIVDGHSDYNGDGMSDLLWRNSNGDVAQWLMNGLTPIGQAVFASVPTTWSITTELGGLLSGDGAADTLTGTTARDTLIGNGGADTLAGGTGADTFAYNATSDSTVASSDRITDFAHGIDRIDLSLIDANTITPADQAFLFGGNNVNTVGNSVTWSEGGGNTTLRIDNTGDTTADMQVVLTGIGLGLTATDFVL